MILVTGNLGYIGPVLIEHLRRTWALTRLIGLDSGYFAGCELDSETKPEQALTRQILADVRDVTERAFEGVQAVIHLAALSNDPMGKAFGAATATINESATLRLAALAKRAGVRCFVFASSCSVYGFSESGVCDEQSAVRPLTAYAESKVRSEAGLLKLAGPDFQVTCLRFATACGTSPRLRLDLVLNDFVASALVNGVIQVLSDGTPWRPLIDVTDMARAMEWAVSRERENGGDGLVVNAGANEWNFQIRDLAAAVALEICGTKVERNAKATPDSRSYRVNFDLFRRLAPRHQPQMTLPDSIRRLRDGLQKSRFRDAQFRSSRFIRLNVLSRLCERGLLDGDLRWREGAAA